MFGGSGKEAVGAEMSPWGTPGGVYVGSAFRSVLVLTDLVLIRLEPVSFSTVGTQIQ